MVFRPQNLVTEKTGLIVILVLFITIIVLVALPSKGAINHNEAWDKSESSAFPLGCRGELGGIDLRQPLADDQIEQAREGLVCFILGASNLHQLVMDLGGAERLDHTIRLRADFFLRDGQALTCRLQEYLLAHTPRNDVALQVLKSTTVTIKATLLALKNSNGLEQVSDDQSVDVCAHE